MSYFLVITIIVVMIFIQKEDPGNLTEVLRRLAAIGKQILDHLYLRTGISYITLQNLCIKTKEYGS